MKVPDRFLGYAFCVGDILMEVDADFTILNADGALTLLTPSPGESMLKKSLLDQVLANDAAIIEQTQKALTGTNRLGPLQINFKLANGELRPMVMFMSRLPVTPDVTYIVLSKPYRVGITAAGEAHEMERSTEERRDDFLEQMTELFATDADAQENMLVTVLEAGDGRHMSAAQQLEVERHLKSMSVGGNHAAQLADDRFAVVHERGGFEDAELAKSLTNVTGLPLESATIDAREAGLSDADSFKALAYSIQQFADGEEDFSLEELAKDPKKLMGETTERVAEFRRILDTGSFSMVYQPVVDLVDGSVHHFEALTRFNAPSKPDSQFEMICFAERVGMITEFDGAVISRVIDKLRDTKKQGGHTCLAANVSGRSLSDPKFMYNLHQTLTTATDIVDCFSLEITESAQITDLEALGYMMQEIRACGFPVYLDDFGAGLSGFNYLRHLDVDALKIDGQYVRNALENAKDRAFLRSMVTLCKELGITTVGEWVETREHADLLRDIGVDFGQGYYFGRPVSGLTNVSQGARRVRAV